MSIVYKTKRKNTRGFIQTKALFLLLIMLTCSFCSSKKDHIPVETGSETAISMEEALATIEQVTEVQNFIQSLKDKPEAKAVIRQMQPLTNNEFLYEFYVGEGHVTHTVVWKYFAVDQNGKVFVYDPVENEYVPLENSE